MLIYLVSGDGSGAGKTALAEKLVGPANVWSLAGALRDELKKLLPHYHWHSKEQGYKEKTLVREYQNKTVRQVLLEYGQRVCAQQPTLWAEKLVDRLAHSRKCLGVERIAVDDVRKLCELDFLKRNLSNTVHFHVHNASAKFEPEFENLQLGLVSDYATSWRKPEL